MLRLPSMHPFLMPPKRSTSSGNEHHQGLFLKVMQLGITDDLWMLYRDLYNGMSSAVKWEGEYYTEFNETQGVRQRGIPSTELFKVRGDSLLHRIEKSLLGFPVGMVDLSVPTCADDMILLSSSPIDLHAMINIAAQTRHGRYVNSAPRKPRHL